MDNLNKYNDGYNFIIDHFTENRIVSRYSPKNIEMIILAFTAGRGYQYSVDYTH